MGISVEVTYKHFVPYWQNCVICMWSHF